jgi:putative sigma-54 modulation protein
MNFTITGRNVTVSEKLGDYVGRKIPRFEKYFHQLMDVKVIVFVEKQDHVAEMVLTGDGVQFYGREAGGDFYSASDLLLDKVEKQLVRFKEKHQTHKGTHLGEIPVIDTTNEETLTLLVEEVSAKPADEVEAYLEMKLDKRNFVLFKKGEREVKGGADYENRNYAALFYNGDALRLAEVHVESLKKGAIEESDIVEYDVTVKDPDSSHPKLECKKSSSKVLRRMTVNDALVELVVSGRGFMPYINVETGVMNIIFVKGKGMAVAVPASK